MGDVIPPGWEWEPGLRSGDIPGFKVWLCCLLAVGHGTEQDCPLIGLL